MSSKRFKTTSRLNPKVMTLWVSVFTLIGVTTLLLTHAASPTTATISLSPATNILQYGQAAEIIVTVDAQSSKVNVVQACIAYDSTKLSFQDASYADTPLGSSTPRSSSSDCAADEVQVSRYDASTSPSGVFKLATLTFKAKDSSGNVALSVSNRSFIYNNVGSPKPPGILNLEGSTGATIGLQPSTDGEVLPATVTTASKTIATTKPNSIKTLLVLTVATIAAIAAAVFMARFVGVPIATSTQEPVASIPLSTFPGPTDAPSFAAAPVPTLRPLVPLNGPVTYQRSEAPSVSEEPVKGLAVVDPTVGSTVGIHVIERPAHEEPAPLPDITTVPVAQQPGPSAVFAPTEPPAHSPHQ